MNAMEEDVQPSRTWKIDLERGIIGGMTDGLAAVKQAVFKVLQTERFRHMIYSTDYGHELTGLIGRRHDYLQSEAARMLEEALVQDDRISAIENISIEVAGDRASIRFTVVTAYGSFEEEVNAVV